MEQDTLAYSVEVTDNSVEVIDMTREENNRGECHILRGRQISTAIDFGCARRKRLQRLYQTDLAFGDDGGGSETMP